VSPDALPIFHLGLIVSHLGGSRDLVKRDQQQIGRHNATVEPVNLPAAFDAAHHPDIVADHLGFDLGNKIFLQPERIGRPSHSHNFRTPPANFLNGAFARIAAATRLFQGDLRAFVKRILGSLQPQNYWLLRTRSTPELSGAAT
jgi:hypothetical protein